MLPLVPARLKKGYLLLIPILLFARILAMAHGEFGQVHFLDWTLVFGRVDALSSVFGYIMSLMCILGTLYGLHVKDDAQHIASWFYVAGSVGCIYAGRLHHPVPLLGADGLLLRVPHLVPGPARIAVGGLPLSARARRRGRGPARRHRARIVKAQGNWAFDVLLNLVDVHHPTPAIYLIMTGFILNAAVPPLHAWLPDAYGEATFNGSVFMCAFTTKTAVYALCRGFAGMEILVPLGVIMALYGVVYAVLENDCRRLLAYHIISQVGYMVAGVGLGTQMAINGACAHAFAHILYKGLLFMGCGAVLHMTGESKFTRAGRAVEEDALDVCLHPHRRLVHLRLPALQRVCQQVHDRQRRLRGAQVWVGFLLLLASAGTFLHTGLKVPYFIWFGKNQPKKETWDRAAEPPWNMNAAMIVASALCIFIGCYTPYLYKMLPYPDLAAEYHPYTAYHIFETLQILLFTGLGFFLLLKKLVPDPTISLDMDWFYRKGWRVFLWFARKPVQLVDTWIGELYRVAGLVPLMLTARVAGLFDNEVIDGAVDGLAETIRGIGRRLRFAQRGQMQQSLAFAFAVAAALIIAFLLYYQAPFAR